MSAMSSTPVLEVRDLRKRFLMHLVDGRQVDALHGVSLHVDLGEHVALAGTSGAGKSTLLRCVYRTYLPSSGQVLLHRSGHRTVDLADLPDQQLADLRGREIGYVSQFLRAEPRRPVLDLVARAGVARGMPRDTARDAAADVLRRVGIDEQLWAMHASVLSGGQKQRVNLAAGTISPPRLLLLDEPVSALDPHNRESVLELIASLSTQGVAVLSVFHDMEAIQRLATRVVILADGHVAAVGDPATVLAHPDLEVAR